MKPNCKTPILLAAIWLTLATPSAFAANLYWDTNGTGTTGSGAATGTWGTNLYWSTDATGLNVGSPVLTATTTGVDNLFFSAGTNGTAGIVTVNSTQTARLLTLEEGALTFSSDTISLAGGGGITILTGAGNATISSNLTVSGNNIINVGTGRTLTLNSGAFTRGTQATVNTQGGGTGSSTMTNLSANDATGIIGTWASGGTGPGTTYAKFNGSTLSGLGYSGGADGTAVGTTADVVTGAGDLNYTLSVSAGGSLGTDASINTLRYAGIAGTLATATSFTTKGIMNSGTGKLTFSGAVTSGASSTEMVVNTANADIDFNDILTGTLTKTGTGTITLGAAAHSIGGIAVNQGTLTTNHSATNGITATSITVNSGGTLKFGGADKHDNGALFTVNAGGTFNLNASGDTIGAITGAGSITNTGALATLTLSSGTQTFSGVIGGATALTINGATQTLSGANNYTGNTTVSAGTLEISGTGYINGAGSSVTTTTTVATGAQITLSSVATINVLGYGPSANWTVAGTINSTGGSAQTLPGNVTLNNGTLTGIASTGGNTQYGTFYNAANTIITANGPSNAISAGNVGLRSSFRLTLATPLSGDALSVSSVLGVTGGQVAGGLTKTGNGTVTLSGANVYTGTTIVSGGTLALQGGSQNSPITVQTGATLGFDIAAPTTSTKSVTLNAGHKISVSGSPTLPSYTLLTTTATITGTPNLNPAIPGYTLTGGGGNTLKLVLASTFASWISNPAFGLAPADQDLGDDPDGDGIGNGVENFFGTNPGSFSQGLAAGIKSGNTFTFTHPQNATPASDLTASYRWSKDLASFFTTGATDGAGTTVAFTTQADTPSPGITTVTATVTGTATSNLFVRVNVTQP